MAGGITPGFSGNVSSLGLFLTRFHDYPARSSWWTLRENPRTACPNIFPLCHPNSAEILQHTQEIERCTSLKDDGHHGIKCTFHCGPCVIVCQVSTFKNLQLRFGKSKKIMVKQCKLWKHQLEGKDKRHISVGQTSVTLCPSCMHHPSPSRNCGRRNDVHAKQGTGRACHCWHGEVHDLGTLRYCAEWGYQWYQWTHNIGL